MSWSRRASTDARQKPSSSRGGLGGAVLPARPIRISFLPAKAEIHFVFSSLVIPVEAGIQCFSRDRHSRENRNPVPFYGSSFSRKRESSAFSFARHLLDRSKAFTPCGSESLFFARAKKSNQKKARFFAEGAFADRTSMCVRRTARSCAPLEFQQSVVLKSVPGVS
jgi:hypothetical protein